MPMPGRFVVANPLGAMVEGRKADMEERRLAVLEQGAALERELKTRQLDAIDRENRLKDDLRERLSGIEDPTEAYHITRSYLMDNGEIEKVTALDDRAGARLNSLLKVDRVAGINFFNQTLGKAMGVEASVGGKLGDPIEIMHNGRAGYVQLDETGQPHLMEGYAPPKTKKGDKDKWSLGEQVERLENGEWGTFTFQGRDVDGNPMWKKAGGLKPKTGADPRPYKKGQIVKFEEGNEIVHKQVVGYDKDDMPIFRETFRGPRPKSIMTLDVSGLQKSTKGQLEQEAIDLVESYSGLEEANSMYEPVFSTWLGRGTVAGQEAWSKVSGSTDQKSLAARYNKWSTRLMSEYVKWRKAITGVAFGVAEKKELEETFPNQFDSPVALIAKMNEIRKWSRKALEIKKKIREGGLPEIKIEGTEDSLLDELSNTPEEEQ